MIADYLHLPLKEARAAFELEFIRCQLLKHGGNATRTAKALGYGRAGLNRKKKRAATVSGASSPGST